MRTSKAMLALFVSIALAFGLARSTALASLSAADAKTAPYTAQADNSIPIATGAWGTCDWEISPAGVLTVHPGTGIEGKSSPWTQYKHSITKVVFKAESGKKVVAPANSSHLLDGLFKATAINLSGLDTSNVTNMDSMFAYCSNVAKMNLTPLDTARVTNMSSMFSLCNSLKSIDLSPLDTSKVEDMSYMFNYCSSLTKLDARPMNTSKVKSMEAMFRGCSALTSLDLSKMNTSSATNMSSMFHYCSFLTFVDLSAFDTAKVENMASMFEHCDAMRIADLSNFTTPSLTRRLPDF